MPPQQRIVTAIPLDHLWTDAGPLKAERRRHWTSEEFWKIIPQEQIPIVVAECGKSLRWVSWSEYYTFCSLEAKRHIASPDYCVPDHFPEGYCYLVSEWCLEDERRVILLEMYRQDAACNGRPKPQPQASNDLSGLEHDFYLGLYRYAVKRYQPVIEKRTGVQLGAVGVKDISDLHTDKVTDVERWLGRGLRGFLRRLRFKRQVESWRASTEDAVGRIDPRTPAVYARNSIYVSFTLGVMHHEDSVAQATVHELAHCLWYKLGGTFSGPSREMDGRVQDCTLAVEGYATYAERIWFRDSYPLWLRKRLASERLDEASVYTMGMRIM